jgi:DNA-binding CsgD family transcriptional regulator
MRLMDEISRTHLRQKTADLDLVDLSRRELEILRELAVEASNQEIAERLSLSVPTVKHYVHKVLVQLNVKNRKEAARLARREGLGTFSDQPRTH